MRHLLVPAISIAGQIKDEALAAVNQKLADYIGARARLFRYTLTHGLLTIEVALSDNPRRVEYLLFSYVARVSLPHGWRVVRPMVRRKDDEYFIFGDDEVEVVFTELAIGDNEK